MEPWRYELYHHGIKGQKWGVRNGPPYPLEESRPSRINKNQNIYRVTSNRNEDPSRRTYVTTKIGDSKIYLLRAKRIKQVYKKDDMKGYLVNYKTTNDIKLASNTKVKKNF